jgi:hypothetical protein
MLTGLLLIKAGYVVQLAREGVAAVSIHPRHDPPGRPGAGDDPPPDDPESAGLEAAEHQRADHEPTEYQPDEYEPL